MLLKSIRLINFRCFVDSGEIPFQKFSLLIGKNDGGKSSVLYALSRLFSPKESFDLNDCWFDPDTETRKDLEVRVRLQDQDGNSLHIRAIHSEGKQTIRQIEAPCVGIADLDQDLGSLNLSTLKELCTKYGLEPAGPRTQKQTFLDALLDLRGSKDSHLDWKLLPSELEDQLPIVHLYESIDDVGPDKVIKDVLTRHFKDNLLETHKAKLAGIRSDVEASLNNQAQQLIPALKEHSPTVQGISIRLDEGSFSQLTIQEVRITQSGGRSIDWDRIGAGKKREMSLGIFRWQQKMLKDNLVSENETPKRPILALFDEPDVNLDYQAQRLVSRLLQELSGFENCQVLVATHSINFVDVFPLENIVFFDTPPKSPWRFEVGDGESETLENIRQTLGLRNSALFNEQLMLVFEGETESQVFGVLYPQITNYMMLLDGIYPINGQDKIRALQVAKLLKQSNKQIHLVLDTDCRTDGRMKVSSAEEMRREHGFVSDEVTFFGNIELEDMFSNELWVEVLGKLHPKMDGTEWRVDEIQALRGAGIKFSSELDKLVQRLSGGTISKPQVGYEVAQEAVARNEIPDALKQFILQIRDKARAI